jgi:FkbM family methyltransferase
MQEGDTLLNLPRLTLGMEPHVRKIFAGEYAVPLLTPPRVVLDIGANEGGFTAWALQTWPEALVFAYEPNPASIERFKQHHGTNPRVALHDVAVASRRTLTLFRGKNNSGECSCHDLGEQLTTESFSVPCLPPENLPPAEFIKVDTEGCEVEILRKLDLSAAQAVVCEYHRQADRPLLEEILARAGLRSYEHVRSGEHRGILKFAHPAVVPKAKPSKLFVALPVYGGLNPLFSQCLLKLISNPPCELSVRMNCGDSLVSRSRNSLTADFLESDCTHLLFIDTDLIFSNEHVARILAQPEPVVGGLYPKKQQGPLAWVINATEKPSPVLPSGLQRVRYVGTGFLRVARHVFEEMIRWFGDDLAYTPDQDRVRTEHDFWTVGTYKYANGFKRYLSEDWYFCQRWMDMGGDVYADTRIILKHVGQAIYPLKTQEQELFGTLNPKSVADGAGRTTSPPSAGAAFSAPPQLQCT